VAGVAVLRLEASEFAGPGRWRWVLTGPGERFLADHEVDLDTTRWEFEAFTGLQGYLRWHVAPDKRLEQEADVIAGVGVWAGERVLGPVGAAMVAQRGPVVVRVAVKEGEPPEAEQLLFRPLELAHVNGKPLAAQGVTLVMDPPGAGEAPGVPVGGRLRVLGLFSLPVGGRPLNLRRERQALVGMFAEIAGGGRAVEVRVLQYGVTRDRLQKVLEDADGWDVIHISGHGAPGELELETAEGAGDPVTASELVGMLEAAGSERVKLVSVSACWSAAMTLVEQRRLLRLPGPQDAGGSQPDAGAAVPGGAGDSSEGKGLRAAGPSVETEAPAGSLAVELADRLGCAVLAMRFPVVDDFAIGLAERFYGLVAGMGQPVARAVGIALSDPKVVANPPTLGCPPLSVVTPALFGASAVDLTLKAPERAGPVTADPRLLRLAGFPPQPDRFVGRTGVMARASAALAPRSGASGVLLHGMPGGGKTACSLELAYTHELAFEVLVWFKAPDAGLDIADALTRFTLTLETSLPRLQLVHLLEDPVKLAAFLPSLTELLKRNRILIVVDNIESLLTEAGRWRDARWEPVITALTGHDGLGRVVLTSRQVPAELDGRVKVLGVDALSADEALLLARQLPHLSALMDATLPGVDIPVARDLAAGVLEVAQGHPKLLELAEGQAAHPERLQHLLDTAGQAWREAGGLPEGFFATGETTAGGEDFLHVLAAWTQAAVAGLMPAARVLFCFLCCLEEHDRIRPVLEDNWANLWHRLGRDGDPPELDEHLAAVASVGVAAIQPETDQAYEGYGIHPGIADAGRDLAGQEFREAADTELADYWTAVAKQAQDREAEEETSGLVIRAGLSAAPYLVRLGRWAQAASMLQEAIMRDSSRATAGAALPALRAIATALAGTNNEHAAVGILARALEQVDPAAAERQTEEVLAAAVDRRDYKSAAAAASNLVYYRLQAGRLSEALRLADDGIGYSRQAGFGPWTQLNDQARRLQILNFMGQSEKVLDEVSQLRGHMITLPNTSQQQDPVNPFHAREQLLDVGRSAAMRLGRWKEALQLSTALLASMTGRGAPETQTAQVRFNDYTPLLRLGRLEDAIALLVQCREIFEGAHDLWMLGKVISALADTESRRSHGEVAISLECDALRYKYLAQDVDGIQVSHHNLGDYLRDAADPGAALVHHLASALLCQVTGISGAEQSVTGAAADLRADSPVPADVAELCRRVGEVPGVHLDQLLAGLTDPETVEHTLQELIAQARAEAAAPAPAATTDRWLASWEPVISGLAAASQGDAEAALAVREYLAGYRDSEDWAALADALERVLDGDRGQDLSAGLDQIDTAVVTRALEVLAGQASVPTGLWPAMGLGRLLTNIIAAAEGDETAAGQARQALGSLAEEPEHAGLAGVLGQVLDGDRDPGLPGTVTGETEQAVVATMLALIAAQAGGQAGDGEGT
jgi:hypothetical protein